MGYNRLLRYYNPDGKPYTGTDAEILEQWGADFERNDNRRYLAKTEVPGGFVSTVWLGLDHSFMGGPPLIFETMAFIDGESEDCERYATRTEALEGHLRMVKKYTEAVLTKKEK